MLPVELLSLVVSNWLELRDVVPLDTAICRAGARNDFLAVLSNRCIFNSVHIEISQDNTIKWLLLRKIKVKAVQVTNLRVYMTLAADLAALGAWLRISGSRIAAMKIKYCSSSIWAEIAPYCTHLTHLEVIKTDLNTSFWDAACANIKLEELLINACNYEGAPSDLMLPALRKLEFYSFSSSKWEELIPKVPNVQSLSIKVDCTDRFLHLAKCPYLIKLSLYFCNLSEALFIALMSGLQTGLRCLVFPYSHDFTPRALDAVAAHHGHTLRHLQVTETNHAMKFGNADGGWINQCVRLNTLYMCSFVDLPLHINNSTIKALYMRSCEICTLDSLSHTQFPALSELSVSIMEDPEGIHVIPASMKFSLHTLHLGALTSSVENDIKKRFPTLLLRSAYDVDLLSLDTL